MANTPARVCPLAKKCGGCQLQNLSYDEQLHLKQATAIRLLGRFGHGAVGQRDLRFHSGVAAGVQDLAAYNRFNFQIVHLENLLNIISIPVLPGAGRRVTVNYDSYV